MHRRYRQIARLIYHYCCVRYLKRENGRWVKATDVDGILLGKWVRWFEKEKIKKENKKAEEKD